MQLKKPTSAAALIFVLGSALAVGVANQPSVATASSPRVPTEIEEYGPDTVEVSQDLGLSPQDLQRQTQLQDAMDTIPFADLDSGYAEDGSRLGKTFEIWYRSALDPTQPLLDAMRRAGVLDYVKFELVPLSLTDLTNKAVALQEKFEKADVQVGVTIDTQSGGVVLHPYASEKNRDSAEAERMTETSSLPFTWGSPPPVPTQYGGRDLDTAFGGCTGGFVVVNSSGNRRLSTAGHCGSVGGAVTYGGNTGFSILTKTYTAFRDVATFDKAGATYTAEVKYADSGTSRAVSGKRSWAAMDVGDPVTKYGRATGYTAGHISDIHSCSPAGCDGESLMVTVTPNTGYSTFCDLGDSGGPVMWNLDAYGLTSGKFSDGRCVYMPQQLIDWGQVLTN